MKERHSNGRYPEIVEGKKRGSAPKVKLALASSSTWGGFFFSRVSFPLRVNSNVDKRIVQKFYLKYIEKNRSYSIIFGGGDYFQKGEWIVRWQNGKMVEWYWIEDEDEDEDEEVGIPFLHSWCSLLYWTYLGTYYHLGKATYLFTYLACLAHLAYRGEKWSDWAAKGLLVRRAGETAIRVVGSVFKHSKE